MVERPILKFKLLSPDAKLPSYAHTDDAGFDVYSIEEKTLKPGERHVFKTGLVSEIPVGWYVQFFSKSGLAAKAGLATLGGVIDTGYRGEWGVIAVNLGNEPITISKGDKVAQGIMLPITQPKIVQSNKLTDAERGGGGFGSSGK